MYELLQGHTFQLYPNADIRLAMSRAIAVETRRRWRISKEKQSHKIDAQPRREQLRQSISAGRIRRLRWSPLGGAIFTACVSSADKDKNRDPQMASWAVKEYLATLDDAAFGARAMSYLTVLFGRPVDGRDARAGLVRLCRQLSDRR